MEHMNSKECANYLGVHTNTLYKYVHDRGLPVLKFPGRSKMVFRKDLVDAWVYEQSQPEVVINKRASIEVVNSDYGKLRILKP